MVLQHEVWLLHVCTMRVGRVLNFYMIIYICKIVVETLTRPPLSVSTFYNIPRHINQAGPSK